MCNAAQKMQKDVSRILKDYLFGLVKQCPQQLKKFKVGSVNFDL